MLCGSIYAKILENTNEGQKANQWFLRDSLERTDAGEGLQEAQGALKG